MFLSALNTTRSSFLPSTIVILYSQLIKRFYIKYILWFCFLIIGTVSAASAQKFVSATSKSIGYSGRIGFHNDETVSIYWPGSGAKIRFYGTGATAILKDEHPSLNHFLIIIDGKKDSAFKIKLDTLKQTYSLAHNLPLSEHTIELFKLTDASAATLVYGFQLEGDAKLLKMPLKCKRKIEFYGNSITSGLGVDVPINKPDNGNPEFFNNYQAFGAITARHFGAQYNCISKSGIGITISWFPQIMPEIYDRINPDDSTSKWDFKKYQPDIIVVDLFQNDSWLVNEPNHPQFKARFGTTKPTGEFFIKAYANFINTLRNKYPKAKIICCLGNMDATKEGSPWPGYIIAAVAELNDKNIVTHFFSYKNTPGHPKAKEQQAIADDLIGFIKTNYWK